jgi:hypothetical protein
VVDSTEELAQHGNDFLPFFYDEKGEDFVARHRQRRLIWLILHQGVRYEERGPAVNKQSKQRRTWKMIRQLRSLGYRIQPPNPKQPSQAQAQ